MVDKIKLPITFPNALRAVGIDVIELLRRSGLSPALWQDGPALVTPAQLCRIWTVLGTLSPDPALPEAAPDDARGNKASGKHRRSTRPKLQGCSATFCAVPTPLLWRRTAHRGKGWTIPVGVRIATGGGAQYLQ